VVYARGILHQLEGVRQAVTGGEADPAGKVAIGSKPIFAAGLKSKR
jgi:hypothetical protein